MKPWLQWMCVSAQWSPACRRSRNIFRRAHPTKLMSRYRLWAGPRVLVCACVVKETIFRGAEAHSLDERALRAQHAQHANGVMSLYACVRRSIKFVTRYYVR